MRPTAVFLLWFLLVLGAFALLFAALASMDSTVEPIGPTIMLEAPK